MRSLQDTDSFSPVSRLASMTASFSISLGPSSSLIGTPCRQGGWCYIQLLIQHNGEPQACHVQDKMVMHQAAAQYDAKVSSAD